MFALLDCPVFPRPSLRERAARVFSGGPPFQITKENLSGADFLKLTLPLESGMRGPRADSLFKKAASELKKRKISEIVLPREFGRAAVFEGLGISQEGPQEIYKKTAADMLFFLLRARGVDPRAESAAIIAPRVTREVVAAAVKLCKAFRGITLYCPRGGEVLADRLYKSLGVSIILNPARETMSPARYCVYFGSLPTCPRLGGQGAAAVNAGEDAPDFDGLVIDGASFRIPERLFAGWPRACCREALISQLVKRGALSADELRIDALLTSGEPTRL